jgi:eukaryotic-like serine/threonine-protein kinase
MKIDDPSVVGLRPPTLEELKECDDRARASVGHPSLISWKREGKPAYLLTVTYGVGMTRPTWILHAGEGENAAVVWIAMTTDVREILLKLKRAINETTSHSLADVARVAKTGEVPPEQMSEEVTAVLSKGTIFAGLYEIISQLGHGGMGIVYKARRVDTGRLVGLKVLHPHLLTDALSRARFEQEAQKSGLTHRNLIGIHKFGFSASGQPYIAMDYLDGCPLTKLLEEGPLSFASFTNIFTQVCEGLDYAHSKGVIHRDIKPGNIMICNRDGDSAIVKIVDFGIAKSNIVAGDDAKLTPSGEVIGSPLYMSPEQCAGGAPDPRSDIYSLGCVMYEAATGYVPFNDSSPIKLILKQISEKPPTFNELNPHVSYSLEQEKIVMKALEKDPSRRYQTAEELGRDLWQLTVMGSSGIVRSFGGDLRKAGVPGAELAAPAAKPALQPAPRPEAVERKAALTPLESAAPAGAGDLVDAIKSAGKPKKQVTFRFRKIKANFDKDQIIQAVELGLRMIKKGADLSVFLDNEAAHLVHRSNLMAPEFHSDLGTTEKIQSIQASLQRLVKAGGTVAVPEHWLRYFGILSGGGDALLPGITVLDEDQLAEFLLERASSVMDYT